MPLSFQMTCWRVIGAICDFVNFDLDMPGFGGERQLRKQVTFKGGMVRQAFTRGWAWRENAKD